MLELKRPLLSSTAGVELASGERLPADVVIVASGRFCSLPRWLAAAGWEALPVEKVDAGLTYCARDYEIPADWDSVRAPLPITIAVVHVAGFHRSRASASVAAVPLLPLLLLPLPLPPLLLPL